MGVLEQGRYKRHWAGRQAGRQAGNRGSREGEGQAGGKALGRQRTCAHGQQLRTWLGSRPASLVVSTLPLRFRSTRPSVVWLGPLQKLQLLARICLEAAPAASPALGRLHSSQG